MTHHFSYVGEIPSVNDAYKVGRGRSGKARFFKNKRYERLQGRIGWTAEQQKANRGGVIEGPFLIFMRYWFKNVKGRDVDGSLKFVIDAL